METSDSEALAQPTRARLFDLLTELDRPASTGELARQVGLHRNGVRVHLERLAREGLIQRTRQPHGRGRPPDTWALSPQARERAGVPVRYQQLGRWLARALGARDRGIRGIERTGREIGRELAGDRGGHRADSLEHALTELGFRPTLSSDDAGTLSICLGNCPFRDAVRENQAAVCALHKGITAGLLDEFAPQARLTRFVPQDPDRAGCTVEVTRFAPAPERG